MTFPPVSPLSVAVPVPTLIVISPPSPSAAVPVIILIYPELLVSPVVTPVLNSNLPDIGDEAEPRLKSPLVPALPSPVVILIEPPLELAPLELPADREIYPPTVDADSPTAIAILPEFPISVAPVEMRISPEFEEAPTASLALVDKVNPPVVREAASEVPPDVSVIEPPLSPVVVPVLEPAVISIEPKPIVDSPTLT